VYVAVIVSSKYVLSQEEYGGNTGKGYGELGGGVERMK
jgi:hypothetical protein